MASYLVTQGYQIVNDAYADALGISTASALEMTNVVDMGKALSSFDLVDKWYGALTNRIVKTVMFARAYSSDTRKILRDEQNFGAFIQKIYVKGVNAVESKSYKHSESSPYGFEQSSPYDINTTLEVEQMIYGTEVAWDYEFIMPEIQIRKAFTSDAEMMAFVNAQYVAVNNDIECEKENLVNATVNTSVCNALVNGGKNQVRNLLAEYNAFASTPLTRDNCLRDKEFLRWANKEIAKVVNLLKKPSVIFNELGYRTFTDNAHLCVDALSDYAQASAYYLESDTYHKELVALPNYTEVPYWANIGDGDFASNSRMTIEHADIVSSGIVDADGIICVLRDTECVCAYFGKERQWSMPNPRSEVSIHGYKYNKGYGIDRHANEVVFIISDNPIKTFTTANTKVVPERTFGDAKLNFVELPSGKTTSDITKVEYKLNDGVDTFHTITPDSNGGYFMNIIDNVLGYEVKVTLS